MSSILKKFFIRLSALKAFLLLPAFSIALAVLVSAPLNISATEVQSKHKQKIIALSPHAVELLFAIGAGDRVVATVEYADFPEAALTIPRIGNYNGLQIEKIVELQPDLIVAWHSGNKGNDLKKIESLGFEIFYSHPQNIEQISLELIELGKLTNLESNAAIAAENVRIQHQKILLNNVTKPRIKVFYQLWHDPLRTIGPDTWINSLIEDCNGENVFNDSSTGYPVVSLENIIVKKPEVIIVPHHSGSKESKVKHWQNWDIIPAVKNNQISVINGDLLHRLSPRAIQGLEKICAAIDSTRSK